MRCVPNAFVASRAVDVEWGRMSTLHADLSCARELLARHMHWLYFVNANAFEFPLRTNLELVRILRSLNGANSIQVLIMKIYTQ